MLSLNIGAEDRRPLVEQIVVGIRREIDERHLRPGTRVPSIRRFAEQYRVSRFTVVEAIGARRRACSKRMVQHKGVRRRAR